MSSRLAFPRTSTLGEYVMPERSMTVPPPDAAAVTGAADAE